MRVSRSPSVRLWHLNLYCLNLCKLVGFSLIFTAGNCCGLRLPVMFLPRVNTNVTVVRMLSCCCCQRLSSHFSIDLHSSNYVRVYKRVILTLSRCVDLLAMTLFNRLPLTSRIKNQESVYRCRVRQGMLSIDSKCLKMHVIVPMTHEAFSATAGTAGRIISPAVLLRCLPQ